MLVPLTAIVTTSLPMAAAMMLCAKDRKTVHAAKKKGSSKSAESSKEAKSSKSGRSSRSKRSGSKSHRSKSRRSKSRRSQKGGKSAKRSSKKVPGVAGSTTTGTSGASEKSSRSGKLSRHRRASSKSGKSSKSSRASSKSSKSRRRLDSDAQKKMEKSGKGVKAELPVVGAGKQPSAAAASEKQLRDEVAAVKHSTDLTVVPARLQYPTIGGVSTIEIKNNSGDRKAIKVKCSDNALYRVNPVHGFAEPHATVKVDVMRLNGEEKTDKLVFLVADAKNVVDPREAFANSNQREMMVVPLMAA